MWVYHPLGNLSGLNALLHWLENWQRQGRHASILNGKQVANSLSEDWSDFFDELSGDFPAFDLLRLQHRIKTHRPWAAAQLVLADRLGEFCRFDEAHDAVRRAESILGRPHSAFAELHGRLYFEAGRHGLAQRHLQKSIQLAPRDPAPKLLLARSLRRQGKLTEAESWLRKCRRRAEGLEEFVSLELARVMLSRERWGEARRWFRIAGNESALHDLDRSKQVKNWGTAELLDCESGPVTGLAAGRRLETQPGHSAGGLVMQAQALAVLQRLPDALRLVGRLPRTKTAQMLRAEVLDVCGRTELAARLWRKIAAASTETYPWILAGSCLTRTGKLKQAEDCYRHAVQCTGDPDEGVYNLALILRARGSFHESLHCALRALEMCSDWEGPAMNELKEDLQRSIDFAGTLGQSSTTADPT